MAASSSSPASSMSLLPPSSPPSSHTSSYTGEWEYDVFLCFRGDTRFGFTSHLMKALTDKQIKTFIDNKLEKTESIDELISILQRSALSVVVFSKKFADSVWCLDEVILLGDVIMNPAELFAPGSRIIVTTRDKRVLDYAKAMIYNVAGLNDIESIELFSLRAFRQHQPPHDWVDLSRLAASYCRGNPLALTILGGTLFGQDQHYWRSFLSELKLTQNPNVRDILRKSYDKLGAEEKKIFLDVACLLHGISRSRLIGYMVTMHPSAFAKVKDLIDRSLLTCVSGENIEVHDLLKEMAWNIVNEESKLQKRSSGMDTLQNLSHQNFVLNTSSISLYTKVQFEDVGKDMIKSLVSIPSGIHKLPKLSDLCLKGCVSIRSLPSSIYKLSKLSSLSLKGCVSIRSLPELPPNLKELDVSGCKSLQALPSNTSPTVRCCSAERLNKTAVSGKKNTLQEDEERKQKTSQNQAREASLPLSLKVLNAYGCKSLRTLSSCIQNHNLSQIKWNFGDCVKLDLDMCSMLFNKFIDDVMNSAANYSPWLLLPTKYDTVNAGKNGSSDNNSLATTTFSHPQNLKGLIYYTFLHDDCFTDCVSCLPRAALSVECHSPNANGVGKGTFLSYCYCLSSYDNKEDPSKPRSYLLVWYDWDVMRKEIMNVATAKFKFQATYEGYSQQGGKVQVPILITSCGVIPVYRGSLEGDKEITVKMNWVEN
ncbi:Disease resistance protein RUN1 [Linum perenne]